MTAFHPNAAARKRPMGSPTYSTCVRGYQSPRPEFGPRRQMIDASARVSSVASR
jgi:hypothetical protein